MLDVTPSRTAIIACMDEPGVLDRMPDRPGAFAARIAPDELWLIGPAASASTLLAHAMNDFEGFGGAGLAVDVSDGWSVLTVTGAAVMDVWARFSENPIPAGRPCFVQGAVAGVMTRAIVLERRIHFVSPAPLGYHLPRRIAHGCADLAPRVTAPAEFVL